MSTAEAELAFTVPGEPVAWERTNLVVPKAAIAAAAKKGNPVFARPVTPARTRGYEKKVRDLAQLAANRARWMWTDKHRFTVVVRIYRTYEGKGGDIDNYVKALFDGMNGVVWTDDRHVRGLGVAIQAPDGNPRVEVLVRRIRRGERARR